MALGKEIITIQDAIDSGDNLQEDLYKQLLGSIIYLKSRGLRDSEELLSQTSAQLQM